MSERIENTFTDLAARGEKALVTFLTAGDPDMEASLALLRAMDEAGADILELGVPFSDPIADGPVIQRASQRALAQGARLSQVLELVRRFRQRSQTPVVLFGYINPFLRYGLEALLDEAAQAGVDGFLVVDLPPEEAEEIQAAMAARGMHLILLVSPNTASDRLALICQRAGGFLYFVSMTGVTGSALSDLKPVQEGVARIREHTDLPVCVGFGISTPAQAAAAAQLAQGAVVGSALVRLVEEQGAQAVGAVAALTGALKEALRP